MENATEKQRSTEFPNSPTPEPEATAWCGCNDYDGYPGSGGLAMHPSREGYSVPVAPGENICCIEYAGGGRFRRMVSTDFEGCLEPLMTIIPVEINFPFVSSRTLVRNSTEYAILLPETNRPSREVNPGCDDDLAYPNQTV